MSKKREGVREGEEGERRGSDGWSEGGSKKRKGVRDGEEGVREGVRTKKREGGRE